MFCKCLIVDARIQPPGIKAHDEVGVALIEAQNAGRDSGRIEVVAELPGGGVKDVGYKAAEDVLQAHPDLAGIFAINDPSALGALAALDAGYTFFDTAAMSSNFESTQILSGSDQ